MTEAELRAEIFKICDRFGLYYHHCTHAQLCRGDKGWPDLFIGGRHGYLFAELKSAAGQLAPVQRDWAFLIGTDHWRVWRPMDLARGEIELSLANIK